tara:strand:+ start:406 stop:633 length:228 start_codon:yes stop_codon:yes gene_type:complete
MITIGFAVWYLIGLYSFYYWWTKDYDIELDVEVIGLWICVASLGWITWFIGKSLHSKNTFEDKKPIVLFKKRKEK